MGATADQDVTSTVVTKSKPCHRVMFGIVCVLVNLHRPDRTTLSPIVLVIETLNGEIDGLLVALDKTGTGERKQNNSLTNFIVL